MNTASPSKICLLRFSALGDVSHAIPVVRALLRHYPDARIDWIVQPQFQALIPDIAGLKLIPFEKQRGWRGLMSLRGKLQHQQYDCLLMLQTSARANLASTIIQARQRLGWDRARAREGQTLVRTDCIAETPPQHQVQGFLAFARHLGAAADEPRWDLQVAPDAAEFARRRLPGDEPVLVISPCSSHALRNWRPERYAQVADWLQRKHCWRVALIGGPGDVERAMGTAIEQYAQTPLINLIGKDTLPQMLALLNRAALVMAPDSGPLHWANALGKPVVGLYAATWSKRSGPYHSLELCVDRFTEAARRYRHREPEQLRWGTRIERPGVMDLVEVDAVCERLEQAVQSVAVR